MGDRHRPRRGSLQFWPRNRAKSETPRIRHWFKTSSKILGFAGYKAGMTHILRKDTSGSRTKGEVVNNAATIIECPPLKPLCLRFYKKIGRDLNTIADIYAKNVDKNVLRKTMLQKSVKEVPAEYNDVRLLVYTQPGLAGFGKKNPDIFELGINYGNDVEALKKLLENDIKVSDVFKPGQFLDMHAVTKAKGVQGTVKRFGVTIRQHKSEKTKRGIGSLGPWHPRRVSFRVPQSGKMGYHLRTEFNKMILIIGNDGSKINPKGGILHYGLVKNDYLLVKGSVPGPSKRAVIMTEAQRHRKPVVLDIKYISQESKQ